MPGQARQGVREKMHGLGREAGRDHQAPGGRPSIADEIEDGETGYLIEWALDAARSRLFRLLAHEN